MYGGTSAMSATFDPTEGELKCLKSMSNLLKPTPEGFAKVLIACSTFDSLGEGEEELQRAWEAKQKQRLLCERNTTDRERVCLEAALSNSLRKIQYHQSLPDTSPKSNRPEIRPGPGSPADQKPVCDLPSGICTLVKTAEEGYVDRKFICINKRGDVFKEVNPEKWAIEEDDPRPGSSSYVPEDQQGGGGGGGSWHWPSPTDPPRGDTYIEW
jgi:hypothetical protein